MNVDLVTLVVRDYNSAIEFFIEKLGFELVEDSPAKTRAGRPKRWVVVRPPGGETSLLLARADGRRDEQAVGAQVGGRVAFFLRVGDFESAYQRMRSAGVTFVEAPRVEPYGRMAVFLDCVGNRWDLRGPG